MPPTVLAPGFWGTPTATLDWCESNYQMTYYIAEFWNTISNLAMILPSALAFYHAWHDRLERRFLICFLLLGLVGVGSWAFHMTLLYEMQLFDELPMLWGSLIFVFCLLSVVYPSLERNPLTNCLTVVVLFLYGALATVIYLGLKMPILFQVSYGFLVAVMLYLDIALAKYGPCDARLFYWAAAMYYSGFFVWNIDNIFCDTLESLRGRIPEILVPVTQLHALWHCLAGYGSYLHILFIAHSRALINQQTVYLQWDWTGVKLRTSLAKKVV